MNPLTPSGLSLSFITIGWEVRENIKDNFVEVFIAGPRNRADTFTTSIAVWGRAERDQTPEMLSKDYINRHRPLPGFQTLAQARGTLAGSEAVEVEITYKMPLPLNNVNAQMSPIRERRIFLKRDEKIYELVYAATEEDYESWLPAFQTLVRTFTFREEPAKQVVINLLRNQSNEAKGLLKRNRSSKNAKNL